jgi:hypothetical protein
MALSAERRRAGAGSRRRAGAAREVRDDVPRRLVGSRAVIRILLRDALAKAGCAVAVDAHDDEVFVVDAAEAGLEEVDERELHQAQLQTFDLHCAMISSGRLQFRYIAIEGPIGAGKTALAERLGTRLGRDRRAGGNGESLSHRLLRRSSGRRAPGAALLSAQSPPTTDLASTGRPLQPDDDLRLCVRQGQDLRLPHLDDNELFIYQRLYELLARDVPPPDLVVYLQTPTDVLLRRVHSRRMDAEAVALQPDDEYLRELNEAYHHFFFHYNVTPLLVVKRRSSTPMRATKRSTI